MGSQCLADFNQVWDTLCHAESGAPERLGEAMRGALTIYG
jgi:hypothetical protein